MPKFRSSISRVPNAARAAGAILVKRAVDTHVSVSRQLAPVDKGELRDGIHAEQKNALAWEAISDAPHSAFVEFGTVNMDAQPYFVPGYEAAQKQLRNEAHQVFATQLTRIAIR